MKLSNHSILLSASDLSGHFFKVMDDTFESPDKLGGSSHIQRRLAGGRNDDAGSVDPKPPPPGACLSSI